MLAQGVTHWAISIAGAASKARERKREMRFMKEASMQIWACFSTLPRLDSHYSWNSRECIQVLNSRNTLFQYESCQVIGMEG
jgi:uncharacterized protein involved in tolerance to divalent cations